MIDQDRSARIWATPEPRRFQSLWFGIGLVALLPGLAAAYLYLVPPTDDASALSASFIPYGLIADLIAVIFFGIALLRARRHLVTTLLIMLSSVLLILQVVWIAPQFTADPRPVTSRPFTVLSLNTKWGGANVDQLSERAGRADLVVLVEVTPASYASVRSKLGSRFPYVVPDQPAADNQSMILSRYPLSDPQELRSTTPQWTAAAAVPGIGRVQVIAAHPCNPFCGRQAWQAEHADLLQRAEQLDSGPLVIAGDFNATDDHGPLRAMAAHGFVSATDIVGAGWLPTYPSDSRVFPPLIEIDHVLVNGRLTALSVSTFRIDGTDHLGLITRLART